MRQQPHSCQHTLRQVSCSDLSHVDTILDKEQVAKMDPFPVARTSCVQQGPLSFPLTFPAPLPSRLRLHFRMHAPSHPREVPEDASVTVRELEFDHQSMTSGVVLRSRSE